MTGAMNLPRFEFATASRIVFGAGTVREAGGMAKALGKRPMVVTGRVATRAERLLAVLREQGLSPVVFAGSGEPEIGTVVSGVALAKEEGCDSVIGFGGGSSIDAGKALAAMLTNPGELLDYLEVIGRGATLPKPSAPFMAIPTTAGTGSEVTRNAVLSAPAHRVKVSLRSPSMLPRVALVDPELTHGLPPEITACTGLDALTQLIEPYVCSRPNPMVDGFCVEGLHRVARSLRLVFEDGADAESRADMALASLLGGLALANAGLGAVHGFAGPIGGMFPAPHGAVCAVLLPHVMEANVRALTQRAPSHPALTRYGEIARLVTGKPGAVAQDGIEWVRRLVADLGIPPLGLYGIRAEHSAELVAKASQASSMKANPIELTAAELGEVLDQAR